MFLEVWITLRLLFVGEEGTVLEDSFLPSLNQRAEQACRDWKAKKADGIEVSWGNAPSAAAMRKLSSHSEGKQFYVLWLKDRYGYNIAKLNEAYGLEAAAFTDLVESDFRSLDPKRPAVVADDKGFLGVLTETATNKVKDALRNCSGGLKLKGPA